jgi:cystathionine gamma-synthase
MDWRELETLCVRAGLAVDQTTRAVAPPLHLSTTFERAPEGEFPGGFSYIRSGNPNRRDLEALLARLEGGFAGRCFASGTAACAALFQALRPGDRVLAPHEAYYGTPVMLQELFAPWGLEVVFVDMTDLAAVADALAVPTRLLWLETPSNPLITVCDIAALCELAHAAGAEVAVDNTWATPLLQQPLLLGADFVVHSTTKYLGGHSDAMGGAVVAREDGELWQRVDLVQRKAGAVPSPWDCWLILRGVRTLPLRMRAHCANARAVAELLAGHPGVLRVCYPGLPNDVRGHAIAARQMRDFGGMVSLIVPGGRERAFGVAARLRLFTRATSLGGAESLVEHRASIEGADTRAPEGLLRLSVGLENAKDLIEDLDQALRQ